MGLGYWGPWGLCGPWGTWSGLGGCERPERSGGACCLGGSGSPGGFGDPRGSLGPREPGGSVGPGGSERSRGPGGSAYCLQVRYETSWKKKTFIGGNWCEKYLFYTILWKLPRGEIFNNDQPWYSISHPWLSWGSHASEHASSLNPVHCFFKSSVS